MSLGENIKAYRVAADMTQSDLGRALGLSSQAISKWENGKSEPDAASIQRMCELFNISPDRLYGYSPQLREAADRSVDMQQQDPISQEALSRLMRQRKDYVPYTSEARILAKGMDRMPEADRKRLLRMVDLMFEQYAEFFEKGSDDNDA
ncbi:MAG: helix-turn-helix transcriptional regulator [Oscillospiraceae bacterium]|nr:helix-turn-helix transcriptional regulator [Oscillospiraceae bacterium]